MPWQEEAGASDQGKSGASRKQEPKSISTNPTGLGAGEKKKARPTGPGPGAKQQEKKFFSFLRSFVRTSRKMGRRNWADARRRAAAEPDSD